MPAQPAVNIVMAIDQSGSMSEQRTTLRTQFSAFRDILAAGQSDWRLGVVTNIQNGRACFNRGVITGNTQSWQTVFDGAVEDGFDDNGSTLSTESLLWTAAEALWDSNGRTPTCNAAMTSGPQTPLHLIILSDEMDQSPGDWTAYLSRYQAFAGAGSPVRVHAIVDYDVGDNDCGGIYDGPGQYRNIALATGGLYLDICSPSGAGGWAQRLSDIATAAIQDLDSIALSKTAAPESIDVYLDLGQGMTLQDPSTYAYDPGTNAISFNDPPEVGTEGRVVYGVAANCGP